jgi:hypothetical protein
MGFFLYASFPNSRNKNRAPTATADTTQVTANGSASPVPTLVAASNTNRTYVSLQNTDLTNDGYYGYATTGVQDPSVVATFGVPGDLFVSTGTNKLYVKTDTGITTAWTITVLSAVGWLLRAGQIAGNLESLQDIYVQSAAPATILIDVDQGQG